MERAAASRCGAPDAARRASSFQKGVQSQSAEKGRPRGARAVDRESAATRCEATHALERFVCAGGPLRSARAAQETRCPQLSRRRSCNRRAQCPARGAGRSAPPRTFLGGAAPSGDMGAAPEASLRAMTRSRSAPCRGANAPGTPSPTRGARKLPCGMASGRPRGASMASRGTVARAPGALTATARHIYIRHLLAPYYFWRRRHSAPPSPPHRRRDPPGLARGRNAGS